MKQFRIFKNQPIKLMMKTILNAFHSINKNKEFLIIEFKRQELKPNHGNALNRFSSEINIYILKYFQISYMGFNKKTKIIMIQKNQKFIIIDFII